MGHGAPDLQVNPDKIELFRAVKNGVDTVLSILNWARHVSFGSALDRVP
jgi:hypothetical protein